ncbi:hypothetical protein VKT23_016947 [Stygiomarasmius scandens]|uniref:Uncharacterized protein n=1 Tax=Marasmiellus scandens TaxID=2682957 RepID=A0ABR1IXR1_9AGAR
MAEPMEIDPPPPSPVVNILYSKAHAGLLAICTQPIPREEILEYMLDANDASAESDVIQDLSRFDDPSSEDNELDIDTSRMNEDNVRIMVEKIRKFSTGVSEKTLTEYSRLIVHCENFIQEQNLLPPGTPFFRDSPHVNSPEMLSCWIMDECDNLNMDGSPKAASKRRNGWSKAQKMRAAAAYAFGRLHGRGKNPWQVLPGGQTLGNPSSSDAVQSYMVSLRKRKAEAGEKATILKQNIQDVLVYLFRKNKEEQYLKPPTTSSARDHASEWKGDGYYGRLLLCLAYAIAFLCLLRVDELLNIQTQDIRLAKDRKTGRLMVIIALYFRKTDKDGGS